MHIEGKSVKKYWARRTELFRTPGVNTSLLPCNSTGTLPSRLNRSTSRPFDFLQDIQSHTGKILCLLPDFISHKKVFSFVLFLSCVGISTFQHIVETETVTLFRHVRREVFSPQKGTTYNNGHKQWLVVLPWQEVQVRHGQTRQRSIQKPCRSR